MRSTRSKGDGGGFVDPYGVFAANEAGLVIEQLQQQKRQLATQNAVDLKRAIDAEMTLD